MLTRSMLRPFAALLVVTAGLVAAEEPDTTTRLAAIEARLTAIEAALDAGLVDYERLAAAIVAAQEEAARPKEPEEVVAAWAKEHELDEATTEALGAAVAANVTAYETFMGDLRSGKVERSEMGDRFRQLRQDADAKLAEILGDEAKAADFQERLMRDTRGGSASRSWDRGRGSWNRDRGGDNGRGDRNRDQPRDGAGDGGGQTEADGF